MKHRSPCKIASPLDIYLIALFGVLFAVPCIGQCSKMQHNIGSVMQQIAIHRSLIGYVKFGMRRHEQREIISPPLDKTAPHKAACSCYQYLFLHGANIVKIDISTKAQYIQELLYIKIPRATVRGITNPDQRVYVTLIVTFLPGALMPQL